MKLFKKRKSKFYWYDFTVRGRRHRASTQETKSVRALKIASLKHSRRFPLYRGFQRLILCSPNQQP